MKRIAKGMFSRFSEEEINQLFERIKKQFAGAEIQGDKTILINNKPAVMFLKRLGKYTGSIDEFAITQTEYQALQGILNETGSIIEAPETKKGRYPLNKWVRWGIIGLFSFVTFVGIVLTLVPGHRMTGLYLLMIFSGVAASTYRTTRDKE